MKLPPLNALRAFEAAARHQSFVRAADELCVTQGAISRHVKLLEEDLGVPLFHRFSRGVELTADGQRFYPTVADAFQSISSSARQLAANKKDLRIICPPSFSIRWLIPRLEDFRERCPDITLAVTTAMYDWDDYFSGEFDLGFACGYIEPPKGVETAALLPELLTPVCAPSLADQGPGLREPDDLPAFKLIHTTPDRRDWKVWLQAFDVDCVDGELGEVFPNLDMATKAAVMSQGVMIGDLVLMRDEIETGKLIRPFRDMVLNAGENGTYVYGRPGIWGDPRVTQFREWVAEVAAVDRETIGQL